MAMNLEQDSVGAVVLVTTWSGRRHDRKVQITYPRGTGWSGTAGRVVVDALGNPIDGKGPINAQATDAVEKWRRA